MIYRTSQRKLKIEQHEPHCKPEGFTLDLIKVGMFLSHRPLVFSTVELLTITVLSSGLDTRMFAHKQPIDHRPFVSFPVE
jgi:hypothetical protein